jgi:hypothetical protein
MNFNQWLATFLEEKGIDSETILSVAGARGVNQIPVGCLVEAMNQAPAHEQRAIRDMIVRIDFRNGDVLHYFRHLAQAIAL